MSHSNTNSDSVSDKVGMLCCEKGKGEPNCIVESELNSSEAQRHLVYNKVLPYSDKLDDESEKLLSEVKGNLGKAILMREIVPGTGYWTSHLVKYIRLYGRRFSKEDHIHFIKLVFELIIIPDLDLNVICHLAQLLNLLLKKKKLLSRAELEVPWRPLYNLYKNALDSSYEHLGMLLLPRNLEDTLKTMIRSCRVYFSVESTQEMLTEWRPLICPFDVTMNKAMMYFELFLPTLLGPDNYDKGFRLWFEEFMEIWDSFQNSPTWENSLVWLFSRLAHDNIGYIDWEPYIPKIFTRLLDSFNLPVGQNSVQVNRINSTFDVVPSVNWIASMEKYHFSWETPIPETSKLKEDDVTKFVESIKPVVLLSMFSKAGSTDSAAALQNLATVRPEIVIPPVLDRLYSSLETLTEPHRLTATMQCIVSVARALVQGSNRFPEGPSHVVPLLMGSLPGIDPNDIRKCMVTFQFISTFTTLIPLVDCSKAVQYHSDLTELEQEICLATAEFEDFVLQFMDRCFALIENSSLEHPARLDRDTEKMNLEENVLEIGLTSTFSSILTQSSPEIFKAALRKLYSFVSSHILETKVSGRFAANMCRSAARVNPEATLRLFLPHFCKLVITLTESEDVAKEEILDEELLFSLLLLSEVVRCNGVYLLQYRNYIESVLHRTLHLTNKQGYLLTGSLLRYTLKALTTVYPLDFRSTKMPVEDCCSLEQHLPIKDWGKPGDIKDLGVQWHLPSDEEISLAQDLLESFLKPELEELTKWKKQELSLTREELQRSLNIVHECVIGAGAALPVWKIEAIQLSDSFVPIHCSRVKEVGHKAIDFKDGRNIRQTVVSSLKEVLDHIMNTCEDDTKSLFLIIKIFVSLMIFWGVDKTEFDTRWKSFHVVKKALENKLVGSKQHIRALLVDRTLLQHEVRVLELQRMPFSTIHKELMNDLLRLATSHYSEVRIKAQSTLQACFRLFPLSYKIFLPDILNLLTVDTVVSHEKFKGSLFILLGQKQKSPLILHDWDVLKKTWPAIIKAQHSEKPSIINLLNQISENIQKYMNTPQLQLKVSANCLEAAMTLWCRTKPLPSLECPTDKEIEEGKQKELRKNEMNISNYQDLVKSLVDLIENGNLHWRHNHLALIMLKMLIRHDVAFPHEAVKLFAQHLVHDTLMMRKIAITAVAAILKQQKRCHVVETLDSSKVNVNSLQLHPALLESCGPLIDKPANLWLQYNSLSPPDTQEKWDNHQFVHKTHVGFYICDGQLKVYAPDSKQPLLDRQRADLSEGEMAIYDAFSNQQFVDQLMNYLSLEERKGQDKFDAKRFHMFKITLIFICPFFRLLSKIFMYDMSFPRASKCLALAPKRDPFIREVLPTLTLLTVESVDSNQSTPDSDPSDLDNKDLMVSTPKSISTDSFIHNSHLNCINGLEQPEERKKAANLCKIVCKWLVITITRTPFCAPPEVFRLLRVLCIMQSDTTDDELQKECTVALAVMGQAVLQLEVLEAAISTMKQVRESNSWHARVAALSYLQVMVFSNLFMVMHQPQWVEEITKLVVSLLEDERVEVRETAAETLGGFLHCEFVKVTEELLESFKVKCRKKLKKRKMQDRASGLSIVDLQELTERHAGILGLCACVNAYPYDVPEFLPDVLVMLGDHLNDPQPIPSTIKKTLSNFRRTHHDSWRDHKLKFTDDQLAVITDLLVSPSYYA
ncbi:proteasome activator complex subunit 4-like [Limulus polyphemus]|uniref:Proteasome activator complex subunit 4-like n=1 Tax=Limulus polyphemus TaxID=6850 RepID=A0ABM1SJD8_LIMPO|nr:proteasome activator complex subunit 4-like [Limulus polyphemus]